MEHEASLPWQQQLSTGPYSNLHEPIKRNLRGSSIVLDSVHFLRYVCHVLLQEQPGILVLPVQV
jgi:hypothetical protein